MIFNASTATLLASCPPRPEYKHEHITNQTTLLQTHEYITTNLIHYNKITINLCIQFLQTSTPSLHLLEIISLSPKQSCTLWYSYSYHHITTARLLILSYLMYQPRPSVRTMCSYSYQFLSLSLSLFSPIETVNGTLNLRHGHCKENSESAFLLRDKSQLKKGDSPKEGH